MGKYFPVWLPNRLISAGLEPVLSHTYKSCIASFSRLISIKLIPVLLALDFCSFGLTIGFNLIIFLFNIRGKLSLIRCDK